MSTANLSNSPRISSVTSSAIIGAVEHATGEKVEVLRNRSITATRKVAEQKHGRRFQFVSKFPFIGRGNVLRDCILNHEQVASALDNALRD